MILRRLPSTPAIAAAAAVDEGLATAKLERVGRGVGCVPGRSKSTSRQIRIVRWAAS